MARRYGDITEDEKTFGAEADFFEDEINEADLEALHAEVEAEEEAMRAPEGHYITTTPYPVDSKPREMEVINEDGDIQTIQRPRFSFFGDAIHEETLKTYKLGFDVSRQKLYAVYPGNGEPPVLYTVPVEKARLDSASKNMSKATELYEKVHQQAPKRYSEVAEFLSTTQLRLTVKKFKSGKSGVVGFELAS